MSKRPDYFHCVGLGYKDGRPEQSWCGGKYPPFFMDATHASLNGKTQGRLVACPKCVKEIHKALCNGHSDGGAL